jgi:transglutaminase-like putative cysteine protease
VSASRCPPASLLPRRPRGKPAAAGVGFLLATLWASPVAATDGDALAKIVAEIDQGRFAAAEADIAAALRRPGLPAAQRGDLEFQRERMRRIRLDFDESEADVTAKLRRQIPDLRPGEIAAWTQAGLLDHIDIDGETRYFNRAASNLFLLDPQLALRRAAVEARPEYPYGHLHPHHFEIVAAAGKRGDVFVAPRRVRITQSLTVDADAVPAGETLRAWIPFPREIEGQQRDIRFLGSSPGHARIAPNQTLQRTAYLEAKARKGRPTRFEVSYELTVYAQDHRIDPDKVVRAPLPADVAPFAEARAPHIAFTPALREFSRRVVGDETNPYRIAQKLFAAVDQVPWAGAREYSTLSDISDYVFRAGHGDCGQQTLLLMTLLRMNGIPARWQSGMIFSENGVGYDDLHDWGFVWLAPYGWVPMDVTTGQLQSEDPALRWFYLGGLDAYRVAFNDDYARDFAPAKEFPRSDTVDSQRGEAEWKKGNLYYDQWHYGFRWQMLPAGG